MPWYKKVNGEEQRGETRPLCAVAQYATHPAAGIVFTHFWEKSSSLTQEEAQQRGLEIYWLFWCYLTSSHVMEANSVMGLFCKLITAWVDYSLSAMEKDTEATVQPAVTKWLSKTQ